MKADWLIELHIDWRHACFVSLRLHFAIRACIALRAALSFIPSISVRLISLQLNSWNWIMVPDESLLRYDLYLHKFFSCCLFVHCRAGRTMPCWWPAWYLHSYPPFGWLIDWWSATLTFTVLSSAVVSYSALLPVIEFTSFAVLLLKLNYVFVVGWIDQWIIQHIDFNTI